MCGIVTGLHAIIISRLIDVRSNRAYSERALAPIFAKGEKTGRVRSLTRLFSALQTRHAIADCVYGYGEHYYAMLYTQNVHGVSRRQFQLHAPHPRLLRDNYYAITAPFGFNQIFVIEELEPPLWAFGSRPLANAKTAPPGPPLNPMMLATALITFPIGQRPS